MSKTTTNYGLIKPELTDPADITDMNSNWDKIDEELKTQNDDLTQTKSDLTEHTHTASDVGAFPITGGTLSGTLKIVKNTYPLIGFVNESVGNYAEIVCGNKNVQIVCRDKNGDESKQRVIQINDSSGISNKNNALQLVDKVSGTNSYYIVYGEHNKPNGSYTGNGSATARTIQVGGIGNALALKGGGFSGFVNGVGGMFISDSGVWYGMPASKLKYASGVLTIACADTLCNASGKTYSYEVI